jgi:hypothetical protein
MKPGIMCCCEVHAWKPQDNWNSSGPDLLWYQRKQEMYLFAWQTMRVGCWSTLGMAITFVAFAFSQLCNREAL